MNNETDKADKADKANKKDKVYVVYIEDCIPESSIYNVLAVAFIEDDNPDGFVVVATHCSSNIVWARKDIRTNGHKAELEKWLSDGFKFIDANNIPIPTNHKKQDVISLLQQARKAEMDSKGGKE